MYQTYMFCIEYWLLRFVDRHQYIVLVYQTSERVDLPSLPALIGDCTLVNCVLTSSAFVHKLGNPVAGTLFYVRLFWIWVFRDETSGIQDFPYCNIGLLLHSLRYFPVDDRAYALHCARFHTEGAIRGHPIHSTPLSRRHFCSTSKFVTHRKSWRNLAKSLYIFLFVNKLV